MSLWPDVDVGDALELLGDNFVVSDVQQLAVRSLKHVADDGLLLLLLSLVQAMRHDPAQSSPLSSFIMSRALAVPPPTLPPLLALELFWCLTYEKV